MLKGRAMPEMGQDRVAQRLRRYRAQATRMAAAIDAAIEVVIGDGEVFEGRS